MKQDQRGLEEWATELTSQARASYLDGARDGQREGHRRGFDEGYIVGFTEGQQSSLAHRAGYAQGLRDGHAETLGEVAA